MPSNAVLLAFDNVYAEHYSLALPEHFERGLEKKLPSDATKLGLSTLTFGSTDRIEKKHPVAA